MWQTNQIQRGLIFKTSYVPETLEAIIHPWILINCHASPVSSAVPSYFVSKFSKWLLGCSVSAWTASPRCNSVCDFLQSSERLPAVLREGDWTCGVSDGDYTRRWREQLVIVINHDRKIIQVPSCCSLKTLHLVAALHLPPLRRNDFLPFSDGFLPLHHCWTLTYVSPDSSEPTS